MRAKNLQGRSLCAIGALVLAVLASPFCLADSGRPIEVKATAAAMADCSGR